MSLRVKHQKLFNRLGVKLKSSADSLSLSFKRAYNDLDIHEGDDVGDGRFTLVCKLGTGTYSTVWLAFDSSKNHHCTLKIPTGHAQNLTDHKAMGEATILRRVQEKSAVSRHPGKPHVLYAEDTFEHNSRGSYTCLTFPLLGPTLPEFTGHRGSRRLPMVLVKRITKQILLALAYLHDECGIVHGDLRSSHLMFSIEDPETFVKNMRSGDSRKSISRETHPFTAQALTEVDRKEYNDLNIRLIDLGHANFTTKHFTEIIQDESMRAPEVILHAGWDTSADTWNLGCLVFEFVTGLALFRPRSDIQWSADTERLLQMEAFLEAQLPPDLVAATPLAQKLEFFNTEGRLKHTADKPHWTLDFILMKSKVQIEERAGLAAFLKTMLRLRPGDRARAATLVDHPWLRDDPPTPPAVVEKKEVIPPRSLSPDEEQFSPSPSPTPSGNLNAASRSSTMSSFGDMVPPMIATIPTRRSPQGARTHQSRVSFHIEEVDRGSP